MDDTDSVRTGYRPKSKTYVLELTSIDFFRVLVALEIAQETASLKDANEYHVTRERIMGI